MLIARCDCKSLREDLFTVLQCFLSIHRLRVTLISFAFVSWLERGAGFREIGKWVARSLFCSFICIVVVSWLCRSLIRQRHLSCLILVLIEWHSVLRRLEWLPSLERRLKARALNLLSWLWHHILLLTMSTEWWWHVLLVLVPAIIIVPMLLFIVATRIIASTTKILGWIEICLIGVLRCEVLLRLELNWLLPLH